MKPRFHIYREGQCNPLTGGYGATIRDGRLVDGFSGRRLNTAGAGYTPELTNEEDERLAVLVPTLPTEGYACNITLMRDSSIRVGGAYSAATLAAANASIATHHPSEED